MTTLRESLRLAAALVCALTVGLLALAVRG